MKTALVTGASSGIGKSLAAKLARQGYQVILHGRSEDALANTISEIKTANPEASLDMVMADLSLMSEVKEMAEVVKEKYMNLDLLINNAGGVMGLQREETKEGFEKTIALNLLAPFLLTDLLLERLMSSPASHVINVSSNSHRLNAKPDFNDLELKSAYRPLQAYGNSKLFLIWNTQHLASIQSESKVNNITLYTVHPGAVSTNFGVNSDLGSFINFVGKLLRPFFKTPEQGADTVLQVLSEKFNQAGNGTYFENGKPKLPAQKYFSRANAKLVWDYCMKKTLPFRSAKN